MIVCRFCFSDHDSVVDANERMRRVMESIPIDPAQAALKLGLDFARRLNGPSPLPSGEPDVTYHNYLPITINAPGGDPAAVQQATLQGVNQALAARGMLP